MPALLPIRFRTELARSFHRDVTNTLNVPSGKLNTLNTLDTTMYTYTAPAGGTVTQRTIFSGEDIKGKTLSYTPGRVEVFVDGDKVLTDDYIATNGTSIKLLTPTGEEQTVLTINGILFTAASISETPVNDAITYVSHGFRTGDKVAYFENGASVGITNLINGVTYYVIVIDDDTIQLASSRAYAIASTPTPINLDASLTVGTTFQLVLIEKYDEVEEVVVNDQLLELTGIVVQTTGINTSTDTITYIDHGFSNGDLVTYYTNGGSAISGLSNNTTYYVVNSTTNTFKLSTTSGGSAIDLSTTGNSLQSFLKTDVTFYIPNHGFVTGQEVTYNTDTGSITGLTDATNYFVIKITDDTLQLASSLANAEAGTPIIVKPLYVIGDFFLTGPLEQTVTINTFTLTNYPNPHDYFYVFLANPLDWANEPTPPTPVDSRLEDSKVKRNILGVKKINPSDITMMVRRIDWETGTIYPHYDDDIDISELDFYVFNSNNFRIYKCLDNNNGNPSTVLPAFSQVGPKTLSDGYTWQVMYEVPAADRVKFFTDDYIPVKFYGTSTRFDHNGTISEIVLEQTGSGYTEAPSVIIVGDGVGAEASASVSGGIITELNLTDGGSGYSFAFVQIVGGGGTGASATVVIETTDLPNIINQNVAGNAVATSGQIDFLNIIDGGSGYLQTTTSLQIQGDGEGAVATATVVEGEITDITIIDRGTGYTFANVTVNGDGTGAEIKATVSPQGGHGANIPQELFATTIGVAVNIDDFLQDFFLNNDFRQYGIIKNIKAYGDETLFTGNTGNSCYVVTVEDGTQFNLDDVIATDSGGQFIVAYVNDNIVYLLPVINNLANQAILENVTTGVSNLEIVSFEEPEISQKTGDVIYFNNISPLQRLAEQTETFKLFINF